MTITPGPGSNIAQIKYDDVTGELLIQFRPRGLYLYSGPELLGGKPNPRCETLGQRFNTMVRGKDRRDFNLATYVRRHITGTPGNKKLGRPEHRPYACERLDKENTL